MNNHPPREITAEQVHEIAMQTEAIYMDAKRHKQEFDEMARKAYKEIGLAIFFGDKPSNSQPC